MHEIAQEEDPSNFLLDHATDPPNGEWVYESIDQDPFPETDTEPVLFYANA